MQDNYFIYFHYISVYLPEWFARKNKLALSIIAELVPSPTKLTRK